MSYSNVDKSTLLRVESSSYKDYMLKSCRQIANYIDNILRTDFGYIRADERGERLDVDIPAPTDGYYGKTYHYVNMYKREENPENFLFCDIICKHGGYNPESFYSLPISDRSQVNITWVIALGYTRENVGQDFIENKIDDNMPFSYIDNTIVKTPFIIDHYVTTNTNDNRSTSVCTIPVNLREIITDSSKFLVLSNSETVAPHIGYMTINNVITPVINIMTVYKNYYLRDLKPNTWLNGILITALDLESDISNIIFIRGQDYRRGLNNFFSDFSFKNTKNKMPILPVFLTSTDSDSIVTYDFDKPIQGLFQTSKDFALNRNTRYILDNVSYVSLGNHFLLEEGVVNL